MNDVTVNQLVSGVDRLILISMILSFLPLGRGTLFCQKLRKCNIESNYILLWHVPVEIKVDVPIKGECLTQDE